MKKINFFKVAMMSTIVFTAVSCSKGKDKDILQPKSQDISLVDMMGENGNNTDEIALGDENASSSSAASRSQNGHFVYTESNETGHNRILIYEIRSNGSLQFKEAVTSGGAGTGAGLGSQSALTFDNDHEWLFAVNAGSNTVSSFKVQHDGGLRLTCTESTSGTNPNSVTVHGNMLYVLNHGSDNIHGLRISNNGILSHIAGSTQPLSASATDAPQISFTPDGDWVIVTEKATNKINSFKVKNSGGVSPSVITVSTGATPFGFDFARNNFMVVSNAAGGAAGAGSATSYYIRNNGKQQQVNGAVANDQGAPCWVATTKHGRYAFVTNTGSNSISSYYISSEGRLYLVDKAAAGSDTRPIDIVVAENNYNVYALNGGSQTITEYHRTALGGLVRIGSVSGLPASTTGLATN